MPTVVLLDTSLSMRRPATKTNQDCSRHDLACRGLEWFFDYLKKCFPYEYTSFHTFSSASETLQTFTRDYKQLKEKLVDIDFHDRTDLHAALSVIIDHVVAELGSFAPCQLVIVTDASPGVKHQDDLRSKQVTNIPFSCQLNVVCVAAEEELMHSALSTSKNSIQRLCDTVGITTSEIFIPRGALSADSVKGAFVQLVRAHFQPFSSMLKCGHLQSRVGLTPSPSMCRTKTDIIVGPDYRFPRLDKDFKNLEFPREMFVCGFLDNSCIPAPPHYSRHFVLDPDVDEKILERDLRSPSFNSSAPASDDASGTKSSVSEEVLKPSFRVLLHGSLKCESKTALLKLGEKWYGLLFSQMASSRKANLVLCVLYPQSELPWLGQFEYLGTRPITDDPRVKSAASESHGFPVGPLHLPSFHTPSSLLWVKEAVLQTDVSKVIRYSRKLPDKGASLVKELNKLRLVALTYCMPELLEVLCLVLTKEESTSCSTQTKTLLRHCTSFLSNNKNPQDRLVIKPAML